MRYKAWWCVNTLIIAHNLRKIFTLKLVWGNSLVSVREAGWRKLQLLLFTSAVNSLHRRHKVEILFQPHGFVFFELCCFYQELLSRWYSYCAISWLCPWRSSTFLCVTDHHSSVPFKTAAAMEMGFENVSWYKRENSLYSNCWGYAEPESCI